MRKPPRGLAARRTQGPQYYRRNIAQRALRRGAGFVTNPFVRSIIAGQVQALDRPHGIDISYWQWHFNKPDVTPLPVDFAFQRVMWGMWEDGRFDELRADIDNSGVKVRLSYGYDKTDVNPMDQANKHMDLVSGKGYKGHARDLEGYGNIWTPSKVEDHIEAYHWLKAQTKQPTYLYCNLSFFNTYIKPNFDAAAIAEIDFWAARWFNVANPAGDPGWPADWKVWQYDADGNRLGDAYGVQSYDIDLDVMNMTMTDFNVLFDLDDPPPPPDDLELIERVENLEWEQKQADVIHSNHHDRLLSLESETHKHDDIIIPPEEGPDGWIVTVTRERNGEVKMQERLRPTPDINNELPAFVYTGDIVDVWDDEDKLHSEFWYITVTEGKYKGTSGWLAKINAKLDNV